MRDPERGHCLVSESGPLLHRRPPRPPANFMAPISISRLHQMSGTTNARRSVRVCFGSQCIIAHCIQSTPSSAAARITQTAHGKYHGSTSCMPCCNTEIFDISRSSKGATLACWAVCAWQACLKRNGHTSISRVAAASARVSFILQSRHKTPAMAGDVSIFAKGRMRSAGSVLRMIRCTTQPQIPVPAGNGLRMWTTPIDLEMKWASVQGFDGLLLGPNSHPICYSI